LYISGLCLGQVNIEGKRKNLSENSLTADISSYLTLNKGNTELVKFDNSGASFFKRNHHLIFLIVSFSLGEKSNQKFINNGMGHLRYNYDFGNLTSAELFCQAEYDEFTFLSFRGLIGGGIRQIFYDSDKFFMVFGTGGMYEYEELDLDEEYVQSTETVRSSSYLSFDLRLANPMDLSLTSYYQPDFENFNDYRLLFDSFLEIKVLKRFSFITSMNFRYDNTPPADVKKYDLELKNGIIIHM